MSNVLIGIIGVILFIGLALAGALFLGPRFQESTQNSKASAIAQSMAQIASAANMYRVQEGLDLGSDEAALTLLSSRGYLKSTPAPAGANRLVLAATNGGAVGPAAFVIADLGDAKALCEAIERQSGGTFDNTPRFWSGTVPKTQGCYPNGSATSFFYLAYNRI
jgi:hypothetical protein